MFRGEFGNFMQGDGLEVSQGSDLLVLDPPFDIWGQLGNLKAIQNANRILAFTNPQNRQATEAILGKPSIEMVWFFRDGRWVSHKHPRHTHELIYFYGKASNEAYVGEVNNLKESNKGTGSVGRDRYSSRTYKPRERKMLNSVLEFPRNPGKTGGLWSKPELLIEQLLLWIGPDNVLDPFAGTGTISLVCERLKINWLAVEKEMETCLVAKERVLKK